MVLCAAQALAGSPARSEGHFRKAAAHRPHGLWDEGLRLEDHLGMKGIYLDAL